MSVGQTHHNATRKLFKFEYRSNVRTLSEIESYFESFEILEMEMLTRTVTHLSSNKIIFGMRHALFHPRLTPMQR